MVDRLHAGARCSAVSFLGFLEQAFNSISIARTALAGSFGLSRRRDVTGPGKSSASLEVALRPSPGSDKSPAPRRRVRDRHIPCTVKRDPFHEVRMDSGKISLTYDHLKLAQKDLNALLEACVDSGIAEQLTHALNNLIRAQDSLLELREAAASREFEA
jgi:hypothetical protein